MKKINWLLRFLTHDIWSITNEDVRGVYRWLMNIFKALFLSIRFFIADRIMEKASALTFYTLLAIVPTVALLLGLANGFGLQDIIHNSLEELLPGQPEVVDYVLQFAISYLNHAKRGIIMGIGIVMLLYVIFSLIDNVETVLNRIWQQKKGRTTLRKITDYLSIMILVPTFLLISSGVQIFLKTYLRAGIVDHELSHLLLNALQWTPYVLTIISLTFVYVVIPHTKVRFKNAFIAACIAGSAYMFFQGLFISGQIWVSKYNAIYGSFAALPLLLLWIHMAWVICLYGAELSYASQNIQNFNFEKDTENISRQYRDFLTVLMASVVYRRFAQKEPAPTTEEMCQQLRMPSKLAGSIIAQLAEQEIIRETIDIQHRGDQHTWIPGRDISDYSVASLIEEISTYGITDFKYEYTKSFSSEWDVILNMYKASHDAGHTHLLKDVEMTEVV